MFTSRNFIRASALLLALLLQVSPARLSAQSVTARGGGILTPEALARQIESKVARLRGLKYTRPTPTGVYGAEELRAFLRQEMEKELSPEVTRPHERAMVMFGLYDLDTNLRRTAMKLLTEQVAGFYNPKKRELFLVKRDGDITGATLQMDRLIMAHELVHALQDQYFELDPFLGAVKDNDDQVSARKALVEGDATWIMTAFQYGKNRTRTIFGAMGGLMPDNVAGLRRMMKFAGGKGLGGDVMNTEALFSSPMVDADELIFSYYGGAKFCNAVISSGGMAALDRAFGNPPVSTEQILHPAKFVHDIDLPQTVTLPPLAGLLGEGVQKVAANTLGELRIRSWLTQFGFPRKRRTAIHSGWDGDRYILFGSPGCADTMVWVSIWDSHKDAADFASASRRILSQLEDHEQQDGRPIATLGMVSAVEQQGTRVFWLRRIPARAFASVRETLLRRTQFTEMSKVEEKSDD